MVIEFLCPNGHKIRCADDRANRPAKCPKCGVKFYVPGPEESEPSESGSWATAPVQASDSPGSGSKTAPRDQIEFLCPNGHRLWAAVALQGRPGQCPECGSKFHIPTLADYEQRPPARPAPEDSVINLEDFAAAALGSDSSRQNGILPLSGSDARNLPQGPAAGPGPAVRFLARLAQDLPEGARLELRTREGELFCPKQFAAKLCDSQTLVFSVPTEGNTHTLFVIPWQAVARIEIRGIKELPKDFL